MYFQFRNNHYSFIYYDPALKKNFRLRASETAHIKNQKEAEAFCQKWDQRQDAMKARLARKMAWKEMYHQWLPLLDAYEKSRKEDAPYSWESDLFYLQAYILPYFLDSKRLTNLELWPEYFEDFRDHLLDAQSFRGARGKTLAFSSRNNIIASLNAFVLMLVRRRVLSVPIRCRYFPSWRLNQKTDESVMDLDQQRMLFEALQKESELCARFFWVCLQTGLRLNEALGLSLADLFQGELENLALKHALQPYGLSYFGYLALDSQPANSVFLRAANGTVPRKPLKSKKTMSYIDSRLVPLFDKQAFNGLVDLRNRQLKAFAVRKWGSNPKDYLLFDGLNKNNFANLFRRVQEHLRFPIRFVPHDCRHTFATTLVGITQGNFQICQMILGHAELDTTRRYVHINEQLQRKMRAADQIFSEMSFAE